MKMVGVPATPAASALSTSWVKGHFVHADSLGNDGRLEPGAAQVMTFSTRGDMHSEANGSASEPLRFIQFWILPSIAGLETRVQQRQYTAGDRTDRWLQIMGPAGEDGLDLAQDARALVTRLTQGAQVTHAAGEGRGRYLYVLDGDASNASIGRMPSSPRSCDRSTTRRGRTWVVAT